MNYIDAEIINSICEGMRFLPIRIKEVAGFIEYYKPETHVILAKNCVFFVRSMKWWMHDVDWRGNGGIVDLFYFNSLLPDKRDRMAYLTHITA